MDKFAGFTPGRDCDTKETRKKRASSVSLDVHTYPEDPMKDEEREQRDVSRGKAIEAAKAAKK